MKINSDVHLTYCLNVHPGGTTAEMERAVFEHASEVFRLVAEATGCNGPWGIGLWLSRAVTSDLLDPARRHLFRRRLEDEGLHVATLNGFPYGEFHGRRVKDAVYRPDWSEPERLRYSCDLAEVLADLIPRGTTGTISTVPVTYAAWADEARVARAIDSLADAALRLAEIEDRTGRAVTLALEPEPDCMLETMAGAADFLETRVLPAGIVRLGRRGGLVKGEAERLIRRHLGICMDTVHEAVAGEDPLEGLSACHAAGWAVPKVQIGAALRYAGPIEGARAALGPFHDEVYLHQTRVATATGDLRFPDLPDALDTLDDRCREVRVHYHLPSSWVGTPLPGGAEAMSVLSPALLSAAIDGGTRVLEVEVYSLDLLPDADGRAHEVLADDLVRVLDMLAPSPSPSERGPG